MSPTPFHDGAAPPAGADCLSDQRLDARVAGEELAGPELAHLERCGRCQSRFALFEAARATAAGNVARLVAGAAARRPPERSALFRPVWLGVVATAATAAVLAFVLFRPPPVSDAIRFKGTSLHFVVQRDGRVFPGLSGDLFKAGDALRFIATVDEPRDLLLIGIDQQGRVTTWFPYGGAESGRLEAGVDQALPGSLLLDDARGTEWLVGLWSTSPLQVGAIEALVSRAWAAHPGMMDRLDGLPAGTLQQWVVLRRE